MKIHDDDVLIIICLEKTIPTEESENPVNTSGVDL